MICVVQGMITIVLECIDRLNIYNTAAEFSEFAGEEAAESWKEIVNLLYELLGRGRRSPIRTNFIGVLKCYLDSGYSSHSTKALKIHFLWSPLASSLSKNALWKVV